MSKDKDEKTEETALVEKASLPTSKEEEQQALAEIWEKKELIKKTFAPQLNNKEFLVFLGMGKMLGANPFKKEIYPAKIKGRYTTMVARDFYRRKAQEQSTYNGHRAVAVYENDSFELENGLPKHDVDSFSDRGKLVGAYCLGWRTDIDNEFYTKVNFSEYNRGNYMWNAKPETMIKKVAEAQLLRLMYQGILGNTYIPEEMPDHNNPQIKSGDENDQASTEAIIIDEE